MGGLVEEQVEKSISALVEQNSELAKEVAESDYKINKIEVEIDESCAQLIGIIHFNQITQVKVSSSL
jgi:phosphate transport system protein